MEEGTKAEARLISAAAFVEGGVQDACDDACSICLEAFSESDPPTVTGCKHEFHLQCILEWCQRSSQCPMCWQSISLKDPSSQELLDAIEQERSIANNPSMNATIFHHPTFGDFELQHLPVSATDAELEERIIQHLAAAAAMGRARHIARREGHRSRTSAHVRPRYLGFSGQPSVPSPTRPTSSDDVEPTPAIGGTPLLTVHEEPVRGGTAPSSSVHTSERPASPLVSSVVPARPHETSSSDSRSGMQSSPNNQDRAGPSEQHSFSDFKTRVNAISMRYKESITKTTKSWKERLFSRNSSPTEHGSKDTEGSAGVTTLSRMMDHLQHDLSPISNRSDTSTSSPSSQHGHNPPAIPTNSATHNETTYSSPLPPPPPDSAIQ
uniref:E3 ubiquitin-protein ligase RHF2A isoform X2 n=1 Tax=Erigeron canadensis TaxID=72917 RepID=UPI001CB95E63|nr:E3 ubiquitin-protein ligase RHF2A isoform X2 [Erigeron canadensis]